MYNILGELRELLKGPPLRVGVVVASFAGTTAVEYPDGSEANVRGDASLGSQVYVQGDVIQGAAPNLPTYQVDID